MYELLGYNNIINTSSSRDKSRLEGGDKATKKRSNPIHNDLSENLVNSVVKTDGPKLV
jgi:hypothetical protein